MTTKAGQPEILRAAQRDKVFQKRLAENVSEVFQSICGIHFWIKYRNSIKSFSNLLYNLMTTMSNTQTLGEEYTGMIQIQSSGKALPQKYMQFIMILLNIFGEKVLINGLKKFEKMIENLPQEHPLQPARRKEFVKMSTAFRASLPYIKKFHRSIFFLNGMYFDISKRLTDIRYVLVRFWLKERSFFKAYRLLGMVSLVHLLLHSFFAIRNYKNFYVKEESISSLNSEPVDSSNKCSLCLNARENTSVTPCGHLFCWPCIITWLQEQAKCPLCRQAFQPSRVVFLQNYSTST